MSYRMIWCAGALAGTLCSGALLAQHTPERQDRPDREQFRDQQTRPGLTLERGEREFLDKLTGNWSVEVRAWDYATTPAPGVRPGESRTPGVTPGATPGTTPGATPGTQGQEQRIEAQIRQALTAAGVSATEARTKSQTLARRIVQENMSQTQIESELRDELIDCGLDQSKAQQEARRLAPQVHRLASERPGAPGTPGTPGTPRTPAGEPNQQAIEQQVQQALIAAGVSTTEARTKSQELARRIVQENMSQTQIESALRDEFIDCGLDRSQAQQEARRLAPQVHRLASERPGTPGTPGTPRTPAGQPNQQAIEQQVQQALIGAGVARAEAQREAQTLSRRFVQERMTQAQIETELRTTMTRHGVEQSRAQQESRRVAVQIHQSLQTDRPGITPDEDPTAFPPGIDPDSRTAQPWLTPETREPTVTASGTSERKWVLNENILQEDINVSVQGMEAISPGLRQPARPGAQPREFDSPVDRLRQEEDFSGHAMFGFNQHGNMLCHVWADNTGGNLHYSMGKYDSQQKTVVFYTVDSDALNRMLPTTPGMRPGTATQPQPREGGAFGNMQNMVVLRIISDDEHVVEYFRNQPGRTAQRVMEVRYTRN